MSGSAVSPVKVLLVDDEPSNLLALEAVLDGLNVDTVEAHSGREALRLLQGDEYAVVLLDVQMAELDGFQTAQLIRARDETRHTPIVFLTAYDTDRPSVEKAYALGAVDLLVKPILPIVLRAKVAGFVELFQYRRQLAAQAERLRLTERRDFERKLASIVESSDDAIIGEDPNGIILSWNHGAERIFGYPAAEVVGRPVAMLAPPDRPDEVPAFLERIRRGERIENFDTYRRAKDGRLVPVSLTISPIKDEEGRIVGASKIARDISERKRAEEALREEKERLHATLTGIGDAVIVTDAAGRITLMNPVAESLTGWMEDAVGRPLEEVFHIVNEYTRVLADNPVQRVIREGLIVGLANHTSLIAKDGRETPIEDSAAPVRTGGGDVAGVVLVFRDASERRAAEDAAHKHQQILRLVHQIGKIGYWEWNTVTDENKWSPEIEALYGLPPGGFEGSYQSWAKLLHPDDRPRAEADVKQALESGEYFSEFRVVWPDGSVHWLETRALVLKDEHNRPVRIVGVNMDITERKQQEEALRASEVRWRLLWEAASVLLTTVEPEVMLRELFAKIGSHLGLDVFVNFMANDSGGGFRLVSYLGISEEAATRFARMEYGKSIAGIVAAKRQPLIFNRVQESDNPLVQLVKSQGIRVYAGYPLQCNHDLLGTLAFGSRSRDRFDEDELEFLRTICYYVAVAYERLYLVHQLRDADRRKDEFLATLAHELRNPLAPVRYAVELLRTSGEAALKDRALGIIGRQIDQMVRLIDDLLDVNRISQGKVRLRPERVELGAVVASAIEVVEPLIQAQKHELSVTLPSEPVFLNADATRLAQVVSNLLNNAAKYTEQGGRIWLAAERHGNEAVITVRDSGIGIAPENLPKLFRMFSQVTPAIERSQGGLGIGLSLVRGLVELHGGRVEARSAGVGHGSEFIVYLPVAEEAGSDRPATVSESTRPVSRSAKVLVVDDNRDAADSLALVLRLQGHETRTAYDGEEALAVAADYRPEVILLDIGLPKLNGYEVARRLRQEPWAAKLTLVALTGWGQDEDKRRAQEAGFDFHLTKPVDTASLEKLLSE